MGNKGCKLPIGNLRTSWGCRAFFPDPVLTIRYRWYNSMTSNQDLSVWIRHCRDLFGGVVWVVLCSRLEHITAGVIGQWETAKFGFWPTIPKGGLLVLFRISAGVLVASVHLVCAVCGEKLTFLQLDSFSPNWAHNLPGYESSAGLQNLCWLSSQVLCETP